MDLNYMLFKPYRSNTKTPLAHAIQLEVFRKRRNYNILIVGKTQMRKSTISLTLAKNINPKFDVEKHIAVIFGDKFLDILQHEKLKRGSVVIADDFGVGLNHRKWYSELNAALNQSLQTHGYRGIIVIVTTPYDKYIDTDTKILFDMMITVMDKNDRERFATVKVETLEHVKIENKIKTYQFLPRIATKNGRYIVDSLKIPYPPDNALAKYFSIANQAKQRLQNDLARGIESSRRNEELDLDYYTDKMKAAPNNFLKKWHTKSYISNEAIMNAFNVGVLAAKRIRIAAEIKYGEDLAKIPTTAETDND